ncbi:MATE family efflux transporter [Sporolactobacillus pectinivorans]|uniref:MATE family efflux transporter n=1 Tax=Sporolactobacillus pectinivorans TaxID=1591408 RepID=UPI000C25C70D|nr:MATE family efflux transporter [Sporolactobacillus pectinivorans]
MNREIFRRHTQSLNALAIPLIANAVFGLAIELIDQAMLGHVSIAAFQSVGAIGNFLYTISGILGSLAITFNIYGSRAMGENRPENYYDYLISSLVMNGILGIGFGLLLLVTEIPLLRGLYGFSGSTLRAGVDYLSIMSGYVLLQLVSFTLTNCLKIRKKTRWIFIVSTTTTIIHTCLNYLLIFGAFGFPLLSVRGAALSDIVTLCLDIIIYSVVLRDDLKASFRHRPTVISSIFSRSLPLMGQETLEGSIFVIGLNAILSHIGGLALSGYLLISQLFQITFIPTYMYGTALITVVSESFGSRNRNGMSDIPKVAAVWVMALFSVLGILSFLLREPLIGLITNQIHLIRYAADIFIILLLANLFRPLFEVYKSSLQSVGKSVYVLSRSFIIELISLAVMLILSFALRMGLNGVAACLFFNYAVLYFLLRMFYKKSVEIRAVKEGHSEPFLNIK